MKMNFDCVRGILLAVEEKDFRKWYKLDDFQKLLPDYSEDEIEYCCLKLGEAGFLQIETGVMIGYPTDEICVDSVKELTVYGHNFLENIRGQTVWDETKEKAKSVGSFALDVLSQIAANVLTSKLGF